MGNEVRKIFLTSGLSIQQFADMISCQTGNIYKIYEREDIDTNLLTKICKALKFDFFKLYSQQLQLEVFDNMRITCIVTIPIEDWKEGKICQYCEINKMKINQIINK